MAIILLFGIGGGCNVIGSYITGISRQRRRIYIGLDSTIAACLAYYSRTAINNQIYHSYTVDTIFWGQFLFTLCYHRENWFDFLVLWVLGATAGNAFGNYHAQHQLWVFKIADLFLK